MRTPPSDPQGTWGLACALPVALPGGPAGVRGLVATDREVRFMAAHIDSVDPYKRHRVDVVGTTMAYVDAGAPGGVEPLRACSCTAIPRRAICGATSSVSSHRTPAAWPRTWWGWVTAASPRRGPYRFVDHAEHLDAWFDAALPEGPVVLVLHDWGSALGLPLGASPPRPGGGDRVHRGHRDPGELG